MDTLTNTLITGGAGFIGSNFIPYFIKKYPQYRLINLDALTYAGKLDNLMDVENHPRYVFVKGNICDRCLVEELFNQYDIKNVIHFAAESHVDNSIADAGIFIETNVNGTYILLDAARQKWLSAPHFIKEGYERSRFHHISTDEVYGSLGNEGFFNEDTPYAPRSPYSASKAAADLIVRSYFHTYGLNVVISNCSNNYGPKQHEEKLIPTIIRNAIAHQPIPIYGDGKNIRDWVHVMDHCRALDKVFHLGKSGESYNIGARNEQNNINLALTICDILDNLMPEKKPLAQNSFRDLITFIADRPGHDFRYAVDPTKIENELGWICLENFYDGLLKTVEWYIAHGTN